MCLFSCDLSGNLGKQRSEKAARAKGDIVIGIVNSSKMPSMFAEGVGLAIDEINRDGGISGRRIRPLFYDDENSVTKGQNIAVKLSENTDVVAVVGHLFADVAISVAVTYEESGIIFISPSTTDQDLIRDGSSYTFRNIPTDADVGKEMGEFVRRSNYKKMAILFDSESPAKRLSGIFHKYAEKNGIKIVTVKSYSGSDDDFRLLIADLMKGEKFDALFLGGVLPSAAKMIKQMRDMGLDPNIPIIGNEFLDSPDLWNIASKAAEGTIISTVFDVRQPKSTTRNFIKAFKAKMGVEPDTWAAQGYDAIRLLAYAIQKGGATVPLIIGTTLRFLENWQGVTGKYSFKRDGNITGKAVFFKKIRSGKFEMLDTDSDKEINIFEAMEDTTLRLPVNGTITTIDPGLTEDNVSIEIVGQLFMGLTETDYDPGTKTYRQIPALASKWTVSPDKKIYRFDMRRDVTWTDGKPVTAHDIVWAVQRNIKPETKSPYAYMMNILKNAEAINQGKLDASNIGVRAMDDFTVEFELEHPAAYFPTVAGLWVYRPLPRHVIEKYPDLWTEAEYIQSNGPYKLLKWEKDIVMILKKNPGYYETDKVLIPEVRYYMISEASSASVAMYKNKTLDVIGGRYSRISPSEIQSILSNPTLYSQYRDRPQFCTEAYGINTQCPPMDNPLVRKAISAAIDRRLLIQIAAKGNLPAATYTPSQLLGNVKDEEVGMTFNADKAKQWLAEAGYPDGMGFPEITLLYNVSETHSTNAKAVKLFLKHYLNIDVKLEERDWDDYSALRQQPYTPHLYRDAFCADYPDPNSLLERFHFKRSENFIGWENNDFAQLIDTAETESDTEKRKNLYIRAEQILCKEECVVLPIYFESAHYLVNPRIKRWESMPLGAEHIREWYFEKVNN